jgi:predicted ATPase
VWEATKLEAMFLRRITYACPPSAPPAYPFTLPLLRDGLNLEFTAPVTLLAGDNGTGKSTLLESLAVSAQLTTAGEEDAEFDDSLAGARELGRHLRVGWSTKTKRGFFLRAEDFFAFQKRTNRLRADLQGQVARYQAELDENPDDQGIRRAIGYIRGQIAEMEAKYGADADARSHGEAFFLFFEKRLTPKGVYLLDEPEAPLSPLRQLAFLRLIREAVGQGSQFVIATHSPILLACPEAQIWDFNAVPPQCRTWDELENVQLWRGFLNAPGSFLRRL